MSEEWVKSPCISVCMLNAEDICEGCYRTSREITEWTTMTNAERRAVLLECRRRFDAGNHIKLL